MLPDLLLGVGSLALLVLPGWCLARKNAAAVPLAAGLIIGAISLLLWIMLLDAVGLPLTPTTIFPVGLILILSAFLCREKARQTESTQSLAKPAASGRLLQDWPLKLALIPAFVVVSYRAIAHPLFGIDTVFRWNYLAEQMLELRSLAFYPPTTAADYAIYGWPDGIAPLVSCLYLWTYLPAGEARPILTAPLVIMQFVLLVCVARELSRRHGGERAANITGAMLACSPMFLWAVSMGQETGLTALGLAGLLLYLPERGKPCPHSAIVLAGLSAALGGLAREYGLAFIAFGFFLCLWRRLPLRATAIFTLVTIGAVLPWYARNWLHTGNPLLNHDILGIFPVNSSHLALMAEIQAEHGTAPLGALRDFLQYCMMGLLGLAIGLWFGLTRARAFLVGGVLVILLWMASISMTAAGFTYSLRVLSPALLLSAVLGGLACARWVPARKNFNALAFALGVFALDGSLRALTLPSPIYQLPPSKWLSYGGRIHKFHQRPLYGQIARITGELRMIVLGPQAQLHKNNANVLPVWSPELDFLTHDSEPAEHARRLVDMKIRFLLLNGNTLYRGYLERIPFFKRNTHPYLKLIWSDGDIEIWHIETPPPPNETGLAPSPIPVSSTETPPPACILSSNTALHSERLRSQKNPRLLF
ncbi:MAG: hypothetical protein ACAH89_14910 [Rariglobus sp.]|nr:hypothetical protein [Rariglobus sp.]